MKTLPIIATAIAFATPAAANAFDYSSSGTLCAAESDYEAEGKGTTNLSVYMNTEDDLVGLLVTNPDWSAKKGEIYTLNYYLNGGGYADYKSLGYEKNSYKYGPKGFMAFFKPEFAEHFSKSTSIKITNGDVIVDQLNLDGSAKAITWIKSCVAKKKQAERIRKQKEEKFSHIPKDPFAVEAGPSDKATAEKAADDAMDAAEATARTLKAPKGDQR